MTSTKKIAASRSNATKSTGPKTAQGKKRARTNALRHGLAAIAPRDPATIIDPAPGTPRVERWGLTQGAQPIRLHKLDTQLKIVVRQNEPKIINVYRQCLQRSAG
jgi:hypothetical protein